MRAFILFVIVAVLATASHAQIVPTVEGVDCIRVSPDGALSVDGNLVDLNSGLPIPFTVIRLILAAECVDLVACPFPGTQAPIVLTTVTGANGDFSFSPSVGGCCQAPIAALFEVDPGAVTAAIYPSVGSPDNNGDLAVTLGDFVVFQAVFNSQNECNDIDGSCDGRVTLPDLITFTNEFGRSCR